MTKYIIISGINGSGKTTVINALQKAPIGRIDIVFDFNSSSTLALASLNIKADSDTFLLFLKFAIFCF